MGALEGRRWHARRHIVLKDRLRAILGPPDAFLRALEWSYIRRGARSSCCIVASSADWGLWYWSLASVPRFGFWFIGCCVCVLILGVLSLSQSSGYRLLTGDW